MFFPDRLSPALAIFKERGDLIFANQGVQTHTGFSMESISHLESWSSHLFPREPDSALILSMIRRTFANDRPLETLRFLAEFSNTRGMRRLGAFQADFWQESRYESRVLTSFLPVPNQQASSSRDSAESKHLTEIETQIQELLDEAMGFALSIRHPGGNPPDELRQLSRNIARARCLLVGTKNLDQVWSNRPLEPVPTLPPTLPEKRAGEALETMLGAPEAKPCPGKRPMAQQTFMHTATFERRKVPRSH